jgi:hypothetical protein
MFALVHVRIGKRQFIRITVRLKPETTHQDGDAADPSAARRLVQRAVKPGRADGRKTAAGSQSA